MASWFDASRRGLAMGIRQAGLPLGAALASAVLPLLAVAHGWRSTLVAGGLVALLGAAVFMGCYRRPPAQAVRQSEAPRASLGRQLGDRLRMFREPSMANIMLSGTSLISALGFFGFGWYGPWLAYVTESAPPGRTGFALGLAMSVNQIAIVVVPPALGLLKDVTHSFVPAWGALTTMTAVALIVSAGAERRRSHEPPRCGAVTAPP
ncbi:MFS transporter [Streptomyces sp. NBC_00984]|uniref:MFS transporter n=1 Tax=Streptomyces sp. NBC_00984 TaxID=2903700 RepID=UPI00386E6166|nr:MFS transporter [Streptomyces sp. NBC_00984]